MKGFKAFHKGLVCRGKQYADDAVFEEAKAIPRVSGMHFCRQPLDTLHFYSFVDSSGDMTEFAEVEALNKARTCDNSLFCTTKLKVGKKLSLPEFINACVDFIKNEHSGSTHDKVKIADSKDYANLAGSGENTQIAASGVGSRLAAAGNFSTLVASGDFSSLAAAGYSSEFAASGAGVQIAASGNVSSIVSTGFSADIATAGEGTRVVSTGDNSRVVTTNADAMVSAMGEDSVCAALGNTSRIRGVLGTWITLAEWKYDYKKQRPVCTCVKSAQIDGERLLPNVWYTLKNGEFVALPD